MDFALVRRTDDPAYQRENALFRQMLRAFRRPGWWQELVVTANAAYACRANVELNRSVQDWYTFRDRGRQSLPPHPDPRPILFGSLVDGAGLGGVGTLEAVDRMMALLEEGPR